MKSKKILAIGIVALIIAAIACFGVNFYSDSSYYYTQIDNSKVEQVESDGGVVDFTGGMSYSYKLVSYNENGKPKTVKFGTERKLKEGAFVCLTVKSVQGVVNWSEVQYDELPAEVQNYYTAQ